MKSAIFGRPAVIGLIAGISGLIIATAELTIRVPEGYREATWASYLGITLMSLLGLVGPRLAPFLLAVAPLPLYLLDLYMFLGIFWWPAPLVPTALSAWAIILAFNQRERPPALGPRMF